MGDQRQTGHDGTRRPCEAADRVRGTGPHSGQLLRKTGARGHGPFAAGSLVEIAPPGLVIGRWRDADVKIFSPYVARHRVRLWPTDDGSGSRTWGPPTGLASTGLSSPRMLARLGRHWSPAARKPEARAVRRMFMWSDSLVCGRSFGTGFIAPSVRRRRTRCCIEFDCPRSPRSQCPKCWERRSWPPGTIR
jgi:hypothetical protein